MTRSDRPHRKVQLLVEAIDIAGLGGGVDTFQNLGYAVCLFGQHAGIGIIQNAVDPLTGFQFGGSIGNAVVEGNAACSGIDGTAIGPIFGAGKDSPTRLFVAYGVYGKNERNDNDHQVILQYDWRKFAEVAKPLSQLAPHHSGIECEEKYFLYTGNTTYGIQNLEYDALTGDYFAAVYVGKKPQVPNYAMYRIDGSVAAKDAELVGVGEKGKLLTVKAAGEYHEESGIYGYRFPHGSTGLYSIGNGYFYISHHSRYEAENSTPEKRIYVYGTDTKLYKLVEGTELFELA